MCHTYKGQSDQDHRRLEANRRARYTVTIARPAESKQGGNSGETVQDREAIAEGREGSRLRAERFTVR